MKFYFCIFYSQNAKIFELKGDFSFLQKNQKIWSPDAKQTLSAQRWSCSGCMFSTIILVKNLVFRLKN